MSQSFQITIPDLVDDDAGSSTTPFGRGHGFGGGFGGAFGGGFGGVASSGLDSPGVSMTVAAVDRGERSFFSHARGDSSASIESTGSVSTRYASSRPNAPFAHSSQSSITTTSTYSAFSKKPSFASIRNAFKKASEPPPVPQIDHQPYPVLKNPFNRSTSSLNRATPAGNSPLIGTSYTRPPTPAANDVKVARGNKSKSHAYNKSQHSHSGSIFHASDTGSEYGYPLLSSPPPLSRVPTAFGHFARSETPPTSDLEEDKVVMNPKTPSDYALHAVFIRFATSAEAKIDNFLRHPLNQDPLLPTFMGPGVDESFDETLQSLGIIAQKNAKPVIDSVMRWRRSQPQGVSADIVKAQIPPTSTPGGNHHALQITSLLNERKSLASIYIMCRALIFVLQSISKDALGDALGYSLEQTTFEQFRRPDLKMLAQSVNHVTNAELYAILLGHLANIRFVSITDRFINELAPLSQGYVMKDSDMKYENLLQGLKYIEIKVWPPEAFEEGAEFMESLSNAFAHAHGQRLKIAFADTLIRLLHPIGKTAQAETNNPQWAKAIELIYPKAKEMMSKPRYWHVAFPLVITSLCVAPQAYFLKYWLSCFEATLSKLKERVYRIPAMNGILRLIWTYLYRCQESPSTTTTKLEGLLKHFFPPNKLVVFPPEEPIDSFTFIVHFILSRHPEYGREICLELLQETTNSSLQKAGSIPSPERTTIALQAILLSLSIIERDASTPAWPSIHDFTVLVPREDYPTSSTYLPPTISTKPGIQDFLDRCGSIIVNIATNSSKAIGHMYMFDDQYSHSRLHSLDETSSFIVRRHPDGQTVAYPMSCTPHINLLHACFQTWPRCLHSSISLVDAVDMLLRGVIHVEPSLGDSASGALRRFADDTSQVPSVIKRFTSFLFGPNRPPLETTGVKLLVESSKLLDLWVNIVDDWVTGLMKLTAEQLDETVVSICNEIEAAGLFLISHDTTSVRSSGVKVLRILGVFNTYFASYITPSTPQILYTTGILHGKELERSYLDGYDDLLETQDIVRLEQWRQSKRVDIPLRIADSTNEKDRKLWRYVFPTLMQSCMEHLPTPGLFRESVAAAVTRYHPIMTHLAGLNSKIPAAFSARYGVGYEKDGLKQVRDKKPLIDQWYLWVKVLCATAVLPDQSRPAFTQVGREHNRAQSETSFERERLSTTRGLFRHLTPFLDSEYTLFRDAAVLCISSFPSSSYSHLLEDLNLLASRQFYDDARSKPIANASIEQNITLLGTRQIHDEFKSKSAGSVLQISRSRRQERLHSAVARIYYLTAPFLQRQRSSGKQAALAHVLKFVRNTQAFLSSPEMRDNHTLQRLRRYFCGTVERLFDGMAALKDSDRFVPPHMHLTLYRLCEEWCQIEPQSDAMKKRLQLMQMTAVSSGGQGSDANDLLARFQQETEMLSHAAIGALCSLCQKAFFPPDVTATSPIDHQPQEFMKHLTPSHILERLSAILSLSHLPSIARGKKALRSLLAFNVKNVELMKQALFKAIVTDDLNTSNMRFLEVIADIICKESHGFTFPQVVCLGLSNLPHPSTTIRFHAFNILEAIHQQSSGLLTMSNFESIIGSLAIGTYIHGHRLISDFLAGEHPEQATSILSQIANWLPNLPKETSKNNVVLLLLQSLEFWIPNINLMTEDRSGLSREGVSSLYHLMTLSFHHGQSHAEQILVMWTKLVDHPHESNGHATVRFLIEQSDKVGSPIFISCAANIVACLCHTHIGRQVFEDLCSVIEPARMLPAIDHKLNFPAADDIELWDELNALFSEKPRLNLSSAQFAWLFLADVALQRYWEMKEQLPVLLHALFTHLDHRSLFVRNRARTMLFQLLRSWTPGYDEMADRSANPGRSATKEAISRLEKEAQAQYWKEEDTGVDSVPKMKWLCSQVISYLEPLAPQLSYQWGSLALIWGTSCSIRSPAFRSLQIFRALMPRVKQADFALLLGRLSNTISDPDENIRLFTSEIILTIIAIASADEIDKSLLPRIFWCARACLSTTVESEFSQTLSLLDILLTKFDPDDPAIAESLLSQRPCDWNGTPYLQPALLKGLRSSATSSATVKILQILSQPKDDRLIDMSEGRVRDLYTVSLPWFLNAMEQQDKSLSGFAEQIGAMALREGKPSINKILNSFSKGHFRTKDDFLRQSVASLREHYGSHNWTEIVTLLLGLVLNSERWLRIQAMKMLKVLFQHKETRNPVELLGSELLMPLLRLLETNLAPQALDVLEEPMIMSGGPAAKHVLRMSMHLPTLEGIPDAESVTTVFGIPEESGWCVAQEEIMRENCRRNIMAVFDTCSMPTRPSRIEFEPEVEALASSSSPLEEDLGGIVKDLHDLTSFFQEEPPQIKTPQALLTRRLEARVAAILAKSTSSDALADVPQTPFLDVFKVDGSGEPSDDSDDYSDSDSDADAFIFDSHAINSHSSPNRSRYH